MKLDLPVLSLLTSLYIRYVCMRVGGRGKGCAIIQGFSALKFRDHSIFVHSRVSSEPALLWCSVKLGFGRDRYVFDEEKELGI